MRLLLVRHGEAEGASGGRYMGHTNAGLSTEGLLQARKLRERLARERIDAIYSSDLARAMGTASVVASRHRTPVVACTELREVDFGRCEGMTFEEVSNGFPTVAEMWRAGDPGLAFPDGERLADLFVRMEEFIECLREHGPTDVILVVAHGGSLRTLVCLLAKMDLSCWWGLEIGIASLTILEGVQEGVTVRLLNDRSHLEMGPGD